MGMEKLSKDRESEGDSTGEEDSKANDAAVQEVYSPWQVFKGRVEAPQPEARGHASLG